MKISKEGVRAAFGKAANSYNEAAVVQSEILKRLLDKLKILQPKATTVLDMGSGTGLASPTLKTYYGEESYFALDFAYQMLQYAKNDTQRAVCADVNMLPLKSASMEVVFSASTLQWCDDLSQVFIEVHKILQVEGLFLFSTFGPDTLKELAHCFIKSDTEPRVNSFLDMHEIGDTLLASGFESPVMETEIITVEYSDPAQLFKDLQATGATNQNETRSRGLMGKQRLNAVLDEYKKFKLPNGKYPATYEVIYGHGRKIALGTALDASNQWQPIFFNKD